MTLQDFPATDRLPEIKRCNELTARLIASLNTGVMPSAETPDSSDDGVDSLTEGLVKLGFSTSYPGEQRGTE